MAVFIKDFKMPANCMECKLRNSSRTLGHYCSASWEFIYDIDAKKRPNFCPLIEIKKTK